MSTPEEKKAWPKVFDCLIGYHTSKQEWLRVTEANESEMENIQIASVVLAEEHEATVSELKERVGKLEQHMRDIHSTTSQIKFSWFKDKPEIVKLAVVDVHAFSELALKEATNDNPA